MYHLNTVQNDLNVDHPRTLRAPRSVRDISYILITQDGGEDMATPVRLRKSIDGSKWVPSSGTPPVEYHLAQENLIIFDSAPSTVLTFEVAWWEYSEIGNVAGATHWFFDNAQDVVQDLALIYACRFVRDFQRAGQIWLGTGQKGDMGLTGRIDDLLDGVEDKQYQDSDLVMQRDYVGEAG